MKAGKKTRYFKGVATVINHGSSCVGCMAWETSYVILGMGKGERFRYQSDRVDILGIYKDDMILCEMLVKDNGNVHRFNLIKILDI